MEILKEIKLRKWNTDKAKKYLENSEYVLIGEFVSHQNGKGRNNFLHLKCNKNFLMTWSDFTKGRRCPFCFGNNKLTVEEISDYMNSRDEYECLNPEDFSSKIKMIFLHKTCGEIFKMKWNNFRSNQGCPSCGFKKRIISYSVNSAKGNSLGEFFPNIAKEIDLEKNVKLNPFEIPTMSGKKIWWKCSVCECSWASSVCNRTLHAKSCPNCNIMSSGEFEIERTLKEVFEMTEDVDFFKQKTFENCVYINKLRFDFYIPSENLCIEFNGKQHYEPIDFYGGMDNFIKQKKRDAVKKKYCKNMKINLLVIKYSDFKKIKKILESRIGK